VSTVRYYFDQWTCAGADDEPSLLEQALKKSGGARAKTQWAVALDELLHRGRAKCEEHRYGTSEGV
jgi:hypothetical protein